MLDLMQPVRVQTVAQSRVVWQSGIVIARSFVVPARYDVRLEDGRVRLNVTEDQLKQVRSRALAAVS